MRFRTQVEYGLIDKLAPAQRWGFRRRPAGATVAVQDGWLPLDGSETDGQITASDGSPATEGIT